MVFAEIAVVHGLQIADRRGDDGRRLHRPGHHAGVQAGRVHQLPGRQQPVPKGGRLGSASFAQAHAADVAGDDLPLLGDRLAVADEDDSGRLHARHVIAGPAAPPSRLLLTSR